MRITHRVVICLLIWLLCSIPTAEANKPGLVADLTATLLRIQTLLDHDNSLERVSPSRLIEEAEQVQSLLTELRAEHLLLSERFQQQADQAARIGGLVAGRHAAWSVRYAQVMTELLAALERVAEDPAAAEEDRALCLTLLRQLLSAPQLPLHGQLPYQAVAAQELHPVSTPTVLPAYRQSTTTFVAADLAAAPEAPLSAVIAAQAQAIADAAGKRNWDPVDLYAWVKNNIATEWYWGCMKGAEETLRQRSGNAVDQAALLVALLRSAGYPARYLQGVVSGFPGLDQLREQTGLDDPEQILDFLRRAGIPCEPVMVGTELVNIRFAHVWVEALVPYANYRGNMGDSNGRTWLPLDPSIKTAGYEEQPARADLYSLDPVRLQAVRDAWLADVQQVSPMEALHLQAADILAEQGFGLSWEDLLTRRQQRQESLAILPSTLQVTVEAVTGEYAVLPPELLHMVSMTIGAEPALLSLELPAHRLAGRRLSVGFEPETVADDELINLWGGLDNVPAYLVRLKPALLLDGACLAVAGAGFAVGDQFDLTVTLAGPTLTATSRNQVLTGYPLLLGFAAQQSLSPDQPDAAAPAITHLYRAAHDYIRRWNAAEQELSECFDLVLARPLPTLVTLGGQLAVQTLLGTHLDVDFTGLFIDADLRTIVAAPRSAVPGSRQRVFMQLSALQGSVLEHQLFEENFGLSGISTARLISLAAAAGETVLALDASNREELLPLLNAPADVMADLVNALDAGWQVRVPLQPVGLVDWTGWGYLKEDPVSGAAGYMLAGQTAGGATVTSADAWTDLLQYLFKYPLSLPPNADPEAAATLCKIAGTDLQTGTVGEAFEEPLTVYVRDLENVPVRNAAVTFSVREGGGLLRDDTVDPPVSGSVMTVQTDWRGLARITLVAGESTAENRVSWHADGDRYATWASQITVDAELAGGQLVAQPFIATALPDAPDSFTSLNDGVEGRVLQYAGSIGGLVADRFGNPVANVPVGFSAAEAVANLGLCDPASADPDRLAAQLTVERSCMTQLPGWGECAVSEPVEAYTMSNGIVSAGVVLGGFPDGRYPVSAAYAGSGLWPPFEAVTFEIISQPLPGDVCGGTAPPLAYLTLDADDSLVRPANRPVRLEVKAQLFAEGVAAAAGTEELDCGATPLTCPQQLGDGIVRRISPQNLTITIDEQPAVRSDQGNDLFAANLTLSPGEHTLSVHAEAQRSVSLYDNSCPDAGGCAVSATLQQTTASADHSLTCTAVALSGLPDLQLVAIASDGTLPQDLPVTFTIEPAGYTATSASFLLYQDGFLVLSVPTETTGTVTANLSQGFRFDPASHYEMAVVLNYGWGEAEIWSDRVPLMTGDFAVRVEGARGFWMSELELQRSGAFVLLNNDLENSTEIADDDEFKRLALLLPAMGEATHGSWSVTWTDPQKLTLHQVDGTPVVAGQAYPVSLPTTVPLYLEGLAESSALQADSLTVTFTPDGGGSLEQTIPVTVVHLDMAVDGNRDRLIDFEKVEDEEILFWVNNDSDDDNCGPGEEPPLECEEDDYNVGLVDAEDNEILAKRDLEDFARLHLVSGSLLVNDELTLMLRTDAAGETDGPAINLFKAVDESDKYLGLGLEEGEQQPTQQVEEQRLLYIDHENRSLAADWLSVGDTTSFLFEGHSPGQGTLILTLRHEGVPVVEKRVIIDLREMSYFYDHYHLGASDDELLPVNMELDDIREGEYQPDLDEYVLFVHGWNVEDWEKQRWAETVFKRLWWLGYRGKVGLFDWPCRTLPSLDLTVNYDRSEYRAWHSARVMADLLTDSDQNIGSKYAGQVRLLAHSQGNVVAGETINLAPPGTIYAYVASQAALSASLYHQETTSLEPQLSYFLHQTPEVFGCYPSDGSCAPYLSEVSQKVGERLYSYFNVQDYALTDANEVWPAWESNNKMKPDDSIGYMYIGDVNTYPVDPAEHEGFVQGHLEEDPYSVVMDFVVDRDLRFPSERYEIFSFGAESRSKALGAVSPPTGFHEESKNLYEFGYNEERYAHSRQFRSNIVDEMNYWRAFAADAGLTLLNTSSGEGL